MNKSKEIITAFISIFLILSVFGWIRTGSFSEISFSAYLPVSAVLSLAKVYLFPMILKKKKGMTGRFE